MENAQQIEIKTSRLRKLSSDSHETAEAVHLKYVSDSDAGIIRVKRKGVFRYFSGDKPVKDEITLNRIKKLAIPPAWTNVWICKHANGHLQATGFDTKSRKQYRYHTTWNMARNLTKFSHLCDFGESLPLIREKISHDLALPGLPLCKVLATILSLMQRTCIRIGSLEYEKLYGSFGLTTLQNKHVTIHGGDLKFAFKGKKGIYHNIALHSRRLARIVRQCKDLPGKELFQYYDEEGSRKAVDSGMVNDYINEISDVHFTAKDFRTWAGTVHAIEAFRHFGYCDGVTETKKRINEALDIVAKQLGNTRNVCRKYYVHPIVINGYANNEIEKYFTKFEEPKDNRPHDSGLSVEERILMEMLNNMKSATINV